MKRKILSILLIGLLALSGCNSKEKTIDFCIGINENKIIELTKDSLLGKMKVQKDSFVLAVHDGNSCLCWQDFKDILRNYNGKRATNGNPLIPFFAFDCSIADEIEGIEKIETGYIDLYIFENGEIVEKRSGAATKDIPIFESLERFTNYMDKKIGLKPINNLYYTTSNFIIDKIIGNSDSGEAVVVVERSGCGDCSYCIPNVLIPYAKSHEFSIPVYVVDIEDFRSDEDQYTSIKARLNLTEDSSIFGYKSGFVPTYQYYKDGVLTDAGVFANDEIEYTYGEYLTVKDSYFDGTRSLAYTEEILTNKTFDLDDSLKEKHAELLRLFLEYYTRTFTLL